MSHYHRGPPYPPHRQGSYIHRQGSQPLPPRGPPQMNQQMSNMQHQQNSQQQLSMSQPQPISKPDSGSFDSIPPFNPDEYAGFKELILAASVPENHKGEQSSTSHLQAIVERSVEMNGIVMDSLLNVANCLQIQNEYLAKPPFLTHEQFVIDRENMNLEDIENYEALLNKPIYEIMGIDQL